jgi:putative flippase GtrA
LTELRSAAESLDDPHRPQVPSQRLTDPPPGAGQPPNTASPPNSGTAARRLVLRFEHLIRELGKFGTVGIVAFAVDFAIFNVLRLMYDVEPLLAGAISMIIAATIAFLGNRFWTWRDRERTGLRREYSLYFLFNLVGLLITLGCLAASTYGLGAIWPAFTTPLAENIAKMGVGTMLATAFRFWSYRQIVFRHRSTSTD